MMGTAVANDTIGDMFEYTKRSRSVAEVRYLR